MEGNDAAVGRSKERERVVLHGLDRPVEGPDEALGLGDLADEPAREIDDVDPLIQELAAPGSRRVCTPLALVAGPPAVAVQGPDRKDAADRALFDLRMRGGNSRVVAVVEADLQQLARLLRPANNRRGFGSVPAERLLAQDVLAGLERRDRRVREQVVGGGYDDDVQIVARGHFTPGCRPGRSSIRGDCCRTLRGQIGDHHDIIARLDRNLRPAAADQAAAYDSDPHTSVAPERLGRPRCPAPGSFVSTSSCRHRRLAVPEYTDTRPQRSAVGRPGGRAVPLQPPRMAYYRGSE